MIFILSFLISATFALKIVTVSGETYEIELHEKDDVSAIYEKAAKKLSQHRGDVDLLLGDETLSQEHLSVLHSNPDQQCTAVIRSHSDFDSLKRFTTVSTSGRDFSRMKPDARFNWDSSSRTLSMPTGTHAPEVCIVTHRDTGRFCLEIDAGTMTEMAGVYVTWQEWRLTIFTDTDYYGIKMIMERPVKLTIDAEERTLVLVANDEPGYEMAGNGPIFRLYSNVRRINITAEQLLRPAPTWWLQRIYLENPIPLKWYRAPAKMNK